jgi:hypothetical protein
MDSPCKFTVIYDNQIVFVLLVTLIILGITYIGVTILDRLFLRDSFYRRALGLSWVILVSDFFTGFIF